MFLLLLRNYARPDGKFITAVAHLLGFLRSAGPPGERSLASLAPILSRPWFPRFAGSHHFFSSLSTSFPLFWFLLGSPRFTGGQTEAVPCAGFLRTWQCWKPPPNEGVQVRVPSGPFKKPSLHFFWLSWRFADVFFPICSGILSPLLRSWAFVRRAGLFGHLLPGCPL